MNSTESLSNSERLYTPRFFIGFFYNFLMGCIFTNNALYPLYVTHSGGDAQTIGLFMAMLPIAGVATRPLIGFMIDRLGTKPVMILASLGLGMPCLGYYFLLDQGLSILVWILRIIQGFGWGAHMSAFFTMAGQTAPPNRRNEAIAMYGLSGMASNAMAPFIGETILRHYGFSVFFLVMTAVSISAFLLISTFQMPKQSIAMGSINFMRMFRLFIKPNFLLVSLYSLAVAVAYSTMSSFLAPLAEERSITNFSLFFTAFSICGVTVRLYGRHWGDRFGYRYVLIPGFICYASGLLIVFFSHTLLWIILSGALCGFGHGLCFPAVTALGYSLAPENLRGSAMAFVTGVMDAGNAVNSFCMGIIASHLGFGIVFLFSCILPYFAVGVIMQTIRKNRGKA